MPRVVHFEIPADEPERAAVFYREALGWNVDKWEGPDDYWLVTTGDDSEPGINGGITRRENLPSTVNTVSVPSLDEVIGRVESAGGKVLVPRTSVTGVGFVAYCADTEGNVFGLMEADESAP